MASFTTVITGVSNTGNSRVYTLPGHTVLRTKYLTQKHKVPVGNQTVAETMLSFGIATVDGSGEDLQEKVGAALTFKTPVKMGASETDVDDMITYVRDFVASDQLVDAIKKQHFVQS